MTIYSHTCIDRTPYTYLIGWSHLNKWYYGRRTAKGCHPSDLWVKYFTSSKEVQSFRLINGEPNIIEIRRIFNTVELCAEWEEKFLTRIDAQNNSTFLNKKNGDSHWDRSNLVTVVDPFGITSTIRNDDPKYISGYYVAESRGRKQSHESNLKRSETLRNSPPRPDSWKKKLSDALIGKQKSASHIKNLSKPRKLSTCPHCGFIGGSNNMNRWHNDNCKTKGQKPL